MIPDEMKKRLPSCEFSCAPQGVPVPPGFGLVHKGDAAGVIARNRTEGSLILWIDDNGNIGDASAGDFRNDDAQDGFLLTVAINERLEGQISLTVTGCRDDCFGYFHAISPNQN
jgi:hypothetical protein